MDASDAQQKVLECACLSYAHPEVAIPAMIHGLRRLPLSSEQQQQAALHSFPQHKHQLQHIWGAATSGGGGRGSPQATCTAALLTKHFLQLEGRVWSVLFLGCVSLCLAVPAHCAASTMRAVSTVQPGRQDAFCLRGKKMDLLRHSVQLH